MKTRPTILRHTISVALGALLCLGCSAETPNTRSPDTGGAQNPDMADTESGADSEGDANTGDTANEPDVQDTATDAGYNAGACRNGYADPESLGALAPELDEISGIVAGTDSQVLWVHNDSGDTARIFAVKTDGSTLGQVLLEGVQAEDFEDIARGPCPQAEVCIFVGDTGNNGRSRAELSIYVFPEPTVDPSTPFGELRVTPQRIRYRYPDDIVDCEALIVSPDGAALYFFEKAAKESTRIYQIRAPFGDEVVEADIVGTLPPPGIDRLITAADIHPNGTRVLIRVYSGSFEYRLKEAQTPANLDAVFPIPVKLGPLSESQGEAIAYSADGKSVWTVSEANGTPAQLHHYACQD